MFIFEPCDKQASNINSSNSEQVPEQVVEQALVPYINSINNTKSINKDKHCKDELHSSDPSQSFSNNPKHKNELHSSEPKKKKRSEEHTSELQSRPHLVCRLLLEKKKKKKKNMIKIKIKKN